MSEVVHVPHVPQHVWRKSIPEKHRASLDTRLVWLWNQRFGTVQTVYSYTDDLLDRTAAQLILQAIMAKDMQAIRQVYQRVEGGASYDDVLADAGDADGAMPI